MVGWASGVKAHAEPCADHDTSGLDPSLSFSFSLFSISSRLFSCTGCLRAQKINANVYGSPPAPAEQSPSERCACACERVFVEDKWRGPGARTPDHKHAVLALAVGIGSLDPFRAAAPYGPSRQPPPARLRVTRQSPMRGSLTPSRTAVQ